MEFSSSCPIVFSYKVGFMGSAAQLRETRKDRGGGDASTTPFATFSDVQKKDE